MNLIETYSLATGLKIDKPFLYESYFPMPFKNYITIQASSGMSAKNYDYYEEVIKLILPLLEKENIKIVQLGGEKDNPLGYAVNLAGKTSHHQSAYLLKNAKLHLGNDSWLSHLASGLEVPFVTLFGPTSQHNHGGSFGNGSRVFIESHRKGNKPSFSAEEEPKSINLITPEDVAKRVLELLSLNEKITRETIYIGPKYTLFQLEMILDMALSPESFSGAPINVRMDYLFDEDLLAKNLSIRPFVITTNKPINIELLKTFRKNIIGINYFIEEGYSIKFVKDLNKAGIPYNLQTYLSQESLNSIKLDFFDYGVIHRHRENKLEDIENFAKLTRYSLYKSNKFLLSDNKTYLSQKDWENSLPIENLNDNIRPVDVQSSGFIRDLEHYYIFNP